MRNADYQTSTVGGAAWYAEIRQMAEDSRARRDCDEESRPRKRIGGRCRLCGGKYYVDARDPDGCDCG